MKGKRERFIWLAVMVALAAMLTACSTAGSKGSGTPGSSPAASPPASPQASEEQTSIVIQHAMGEETLPAVPERVVVLDNGALDNLLALNVKPVGAPTVQLDQPYPAYLQSQTDGIANIGTIDEPNLETIASLNPDLILGSKDTHEAIYDKLKQIAPTVFVDNLGYSWKENLKLQGQAIGKEQQAEQLLSDYFSRLEEFRTTMGDRLAETTVSVLRPRADHVRVYLRQSFSGVIVEDAGLPRPEAQQADEFAQQLTEEQTAEMAGDVILWFSRDTDNLLKTKLASNPLWQQLDAVKENRVYEVDSETWLSGLGVQAANKVVDDLFEYVVPAN